MLADAATGSGADWMHGLLDEVAIGQINVLGSHDSSVFDLHYVVLQYFMTCQNLGLQEQYNTGIRWFDLWYQVTDNGTGSSQMPKEADKEA